MKQVSFHAQFDDDKHYGMSDYEITNIDKTDRVDDLRR